MLAGVAMMVIVAMKLFPQLPFARWLNLWLVEKPVLWMASAQRHHILFVILMAALLLAPETLMMLAAVDLSVATFALEVSFYVDALVGMALVGALTRIISSWPAIRQFVAGRCRPPARARRRRDRVLSLPILYDRP